MATTRTARAEQPGPAKARIKANGYDARVIAEPGREYAEVIVSTQVDEGPIADMVRNATVRAEGRKVIVEFPRGGGGGMTVVSGSGFTSISNTGGGTFIAGSVVGGTVIQSGRGGRIVQSSGDITIINGAVHIGPGGIVSTGPSGTIEIVARVPEGSDADYSASGGSLDTDGALGHVEADTSGGNITVTHAASVNAHTSGGNIDVQHVVRSASLRSSGGNICVFGADDASVRARSSGGNVQYGSNLDIDVSTSGGHARSVRVGR